MAFMDAGEVRGSHLPLARLQGQDTVVRGQERKLRKPFQATRNRM